MELAVWVIAALLALIAWKVSKIEKRLAAMHESWAHVMAPLHDPISKKSELFCGGQEKNSPYTPRSVLDQIGVQVELTADLQRALHDKMDKGS